MARNTIWSPEEDAALAAAVQDNVSPLRLASRLNRSLNSVKRRIRELGLKDANNAAIVLRTDPVIHVRRWIETAKAKDLAALIDFYSEDATLECACNGSTVYAGLGAIQEYWAPKLRTATPQAFSLMKATRDGRQVVADYLSYEAKPVRMVMTFDSKGKIDRWECAPRACSKPAS